MGAVYKAEHPLLGKTAAVKVLLPELSQNHDIVNRFFNEAKAATAIRHPGIVEIFDFGYLPSGMAYITMELLDGEPLSRVLVARGRLTEQEALLYTRGIASALAAAHAQGIIHRDLKPDNIFLVRDPDMLGGLRPKILDFGIAKVTEAQRIGGVSKTRTGAVLGTPTYMSPEQCRGTGEIDARSDLYAVGCILYEMLVGRPPFHSEGIGELLAMHMYMAPQSPTELGLPISTAAEGLIMQLLQKRPDDRVQSAADLARLLGQQSMPGIAGAGAPTISSSGMHTPAPLLTPHGMLTPAPRMSGGQVAVTAPTTLSAASGAGTTSAGVAEPPRKSRGLLFGAIGAVVAGGAIAAIVLGGGGGGKGAAEPSGASTPPPVVVDAGVAPSADAAAAIVVDAASPPIDAAPPVDAAVDAPVKDKHRKPRGDKNNGNGNQGSGTGSSVDRGD
ncbi:MAG: serine/threonine protein kinase [Myxococcales bacterium]|nr:serine/threonine protein kinase [Myxococcales bacterium]